MIQLNFIFPMHGDARIVARKFAHNELGISICEEAIDVIEEISSVVIEKQTSILKSEISHLKNTIYELKKRQVKKCVVCMDKSAEFMWSSCMAFSSSNVAHVSVCESCAQRISRGPKESRNCPICRATDGTWVRVNACDG